MFGTVHPVLPGSLRLELAKPELRQRLARQAWERAAALSPEQTLPAPAIRHLEGRLVGFLPLLEELLLQERQSFPKPSLAVQQELLILLMALSWRSAQHLSAKPR
jgi:hypothetical protein